MGMLIKVKGAGNKEYKCLPLPDKVPELANTMDHKLFVVRRTIMLTSLEHLLRERVKSNEVVKSACHQSSEQLETISSEKRPKDLTTTE